MNTTSAESLDALLARMENVTDYQRLSITLRNLKDLGPDAYLHINMFIYALELFIQNRAQGSRERAAKDALVQLCNDITLLCPIEFSTRHSVNPSKQLFDEGHQCLWYYLGDVGAEEPKR